MEHTTFFHEVHTLSCFLLWWNKICTFKMHPHTKTQSNGQQNSLLILCFWNKNAKLLVVGHSQKIIFPKFNKLTFCWSIFIAQKLQLTLLKLHMQALTVGTNCCWCKWLLYYFSWEINRFPRENACLSSKLCWFNKSSWKQKFFFLHYSDQVNKIMP